jgi:glutamate N-acetyltransferase/amino-acid N-acetyltransferase
VDAVSITAPQGFVAGGLAAGIKSSGQRDLAVVIAEKGAVPAAGVFTRNSAAAAPVIVSRERLLGGRARAVVLNSGCANAGTGWQGRVDTERVTGAAARLLSADEGSILMCSTGPIGPLLPTKRVVAALPELIGGASVHGDQAAAEAILTTDSRTKTVVIDGGGFRVGGMAKGAAMLRPDMATMLCVLTTDAIAPPEMLQGILSEVVGPTFNSLNIDGCESTNDTVLLLASGETITPYPDYLGEAVEAACRRLAREMAADAEGASRVVTIRIDGAPDHETARRYGRAVSDSALVRSSFFGGDPNWGRILAALGTCQVDPETVSIAYEGCCVADEGVAYPFDDQRLAEALTGDFVIDIVVGEGRGQAQIITTDLTPDYVRFNGGRS